MVSANNGGWSSGYTTLLAAPGRNQVPTPCTDHSTKLDLDSQRTLETAEHLSILLRFQPDQHQLGRRPTHPRLWRNCNHHISRPRTHPRLERNRSQHGGPLPISRRVRRRYVSCAVSVSRALTPQPPGHTSVNDLPASGDASSFLERERALLGPDADLFATPNDRKVTTVEEADDDLLEYHMPEASAEALDFESAFPDIDSSAVRPLPPLTSIL